jgi:tetratricopeptide (TPR) repeat protein
VPNHPQATLNLGLQYVARGDYSRGALLLKSASGLGLDCYQLQYNLGLALFNLKQYEDASTALKSASALSPNSAEPLYYLGLLAWDRGQDETAADFWDRAVQLRSIFPEANFMLGEALRRNRRSSASVEFYQRALEQDASKFVYYARLGGVYIMLGRTEQAVEVFRQGVLRFPNLSEAHYFAGVAARAAANYETAAGELRKALALEPDNVNALAQLGFVLLERGQMPEAESVLQRAISINAKHFYANYDLGRLLLRSQRYDKALLTLQHAAVLKPGNPSVHYQLFMALSRLKRKDEAEHELTTFKQLDEARKARPRGETEVEEEDAQNPSGSSSPSAPQ